MSLDEKVRFLRVGKYKDKEGQGDLYYDIFLNDFYKEKDYEYLVEFDAPVKRTLHKLLFYEKIGGYEDEK